MSHYNSGEGRTHAPTHTVTKHQTPTSIFSRCHLVSFCKCVAMATGYHSNITPWQQDTIATEHHGNKTL